MMFKNANDIYNTEERKVENVNVGDVIKIKNMEYIVSKVYKFHVDAECNGIKRCFCIGDLVKLGVEPSGGENCRVSSIHNMDYDEV